MAYAAVASLSHTIHLILNHHEDSVSTQFKDQIISLHKHIIFLQSFIEDSPDRANNWDETIREASDRAEDIIELILSDSLLKSESRSTIGPSSSKLEKGKYEVHYCLDELERATEEIDSIVNRVKGRRRTEAMAGSDEELMKIISLLRGGSSAREIIAIVGIGGIGKTTLARSAYYNPLIAKHFDFHASYKVVSRDISWRRIIRDILNSFKVENALKSEDELIDSVFKILQGKRYLIVLDGIWNFEAWEGIKCALPDHRNGSRIILTTTSSELARSADHIHEKGFLDKDRTWELLREKIFRGDPCPPQLEHFGKMVAICCRGHPLSIDVVSVILAADQTEAAWEDVSQEMEIASTNELEFLQVLPLSYTYLPHHLRPCFLYLGCFPEGEVINVSKLVKLWAAEGFLNESEYKSFEKTGEQYVEDLVRRRLVSVNQLKSNGRIKTIRIHNLMRFLCLKHAQSDKFVLHISRFNSFDRRAVSMELQSCRRVSNSTYSHDFLKGAHGSSIRSIMLYLYNSRLGVKLSIRNARLLRILDLSHSYNYDLPEEVFDLFHLRYLSFNSWFNISEAISNLQNLQTLIIYPRDNDDKLYAKFPEGIWRMPQLRHLVMLLFELPSQIGATPSALKHLQTMSRVVDFICSRKDLDMIPNLKKLGILYTNNLGDVVLHYQLHNLQYLEKLEILKIEIDWSFRKQHNTTSSTTSISYAFPRTLKKLSLSGMRVPWEDMKIVASLPNLQVLKLRNHACIGQTWETSEGGFSKLTSLLIERSNLKNWITESSHFPRLKYLVLHRCWCMSDIPKDMGKVPKLKLIELDGDNDKLLRSARQIQKQRKSLGYRSLHIRAV